MALVILFVTLCSGDVLGLLFFCLPLDALDFRVFEIIYTK